MNTVGARVRTKKNDADVAVGSMGTVVRIHEASGHPVVRLDTNRVVSLLPHQLEVIAPPLPPPSPSNGKYHWELFDPRPAYVTLSSTAIRLSSPTWAPFDGVSLVELLSDREKGAIAIRPRDGTTGMTVALLRGKSGLHINAREFLAMIDFGKVGSGKAARRPARYDRTTDLLIVTGIPFRPEER